MISDADVRLSEWILNHNCLNRHSCVCCPHYDNCNKDLRKWKVDNPPPEPTERQRIEWLRMLPDDEILNVMDYSHFSLECADCYNSDSEGECLRKSDVEYCDAGHMDWWHEVVSLEQFRKDVKLND